MGASTINKHPTKRVGLEQSGHHYHLIECTVQSETYQIQFQVSVIQIIFLTICYSLLTDKIYMIVIIFCLIKIVHYQNF
jgi:hypothetical protein